MKQTPNYYGTIPAPIRYNESLQPNAKLLYSELTALCNKEGYCWASNKYFAQLYNTSTTSVSRWFSSLEKEGFVKVKVVRSETGTNRKVYLEGATKLLNGGDRNVKYNNTSINNKKVSKDTTTESKDSSTIFKSPFTKKCIKVWNDIPFTQNIRVTQKTKTIQRIEKYIGQLLHGTFTSARDNKTFDTEWFKKNKIPLPFKKITKKEVLMTIKGTALYSKDGYFTKDKMYMPKDLATLIHNSRTGKSWFLLAYHEKPKPFGKTSVDPDPKASEYLISRLNGNYTDSDTVKLHNGITSIKKFVTDIPKKSTEQYKIRMEVGNTLRICKAYIYWIQHQDWIDTINVSILNANNKLWKRFVKEKEEEYGGWKLT